jgi:hypothetical protein
VSTFDTITSAFTPGLWERCLLRPWPDGLYRFGAGTVRSMSTCLLDPDEHQPSLSQTLGYAYWPDGSWRPGNRLWGNPVCLRD